MAKGFREYYKDMSTAERVLFAIITLLVLFLVWINLFRADAYIEFDEAKLYRHAIEIVRNRALVFEGWDYITTMELDCSLILALPFYLLTKDIYLSFGLANIIFLAAYLFVIYDILGKIPGKRVYKFAAVILFLIPYRIGMLEYLNMMFFNGGQYVVKVLVPLAAMDLFLEDEGAVFSLKNKIILAVYLPLLVLTSMSSGSYVFISGVLPVLLCLVLNAVFRDDIKGISRKKLLIGALSAAAFLLGVFLCRVFDAKPFGSRNELVLASEFINYLLSLFWVYFSIFIPLEEPEILSIPGLVQLVRIAFTFLMTILPFVNLKLMIKERGKNEALNYLTIPFFVNLVILSLTRTGFSVPYPPGRYFFISLIPLFLSVPFILTQLEGMDNVSLKKMTGLLLCTLTGLMIIVCVKDVFVGFENGYEGKRYDTLTEICDYAAENDIDDIFMTSEHDCEVMRLFDTKRNYCTVQFTEDGPVLSSRDFYHAARDRGCYGDRNILVIQNVQDDLFDALPGHIRNRYVYAERLTDFTVYYSEENLFDGLSGLPVKGETESVDFPWTKGYETGGADSINPDGYLNAYGSGDYSLISPPLKIRGSIGAVLYSDAGKGGGNGSEGEAVGELQLINEDGEAVTGEKILRGASETMLSAELDGKYRLAVVLYPGESINIRKLSYTR